MKVASLFCLSIFLYFSLLADAEAAIASPLEDRSLKVTITRAADAKFRLRIEFQGDRSGETEIALPDEWGGQRELYKGIRDLRVMSKGATLFDSDVLHRKTITHRPGQALTIEYELAQDFEGQFRNSVRYRPVTTPDHIHWIGHTFWILPRWSDDDPVYAHIEWKGFPESWNIATSYGNGKTQKFRTRIRELKRSIAVGGDFRVITGRVVGKPVRLAIRGNWQFADAELASMARRVIEIQRDFWNDHSQRDYLVTLVPISEGPGALSIGGTGLADSFALFATENASLERLRGLLAHEYFHNWNAPRLGRMPEPEQGMYWFSEGFTEYYTYELLHRGGLISKAELAENFNSLIREYYLSPVRTVPNERIVTDFWTDGRVQRLPYLRGFLMALNWNAAIRERSGGDSSLDDVMHDLLRTSSGGRRELSLEVIAAHIERHLEGDIMPDVERNIVNGELIAPAADALGAGFTLQMVPTPIFDLGFDLQALQKSREISGVAIDSAAYRAGLRNGQKLAGGFSLSLGDTSKEIELKVSADGVEKVIRYLPVAEDKVVIPQFRPSP